MATPDEINQLYSEIRQNDLPDKLDDRTGTNELVTKYRANLALQGTYDPRSDSELTTFIGDHLRMKQSAEGASGMRALVTEGANPQFRDDYLDLDLQRQDSDPLDEFGGGLNKATRGMVGSMSGAYGMTGLPGSEAAWEWGVDLQTNAPRASVRKYEDLFRANGVSGRALAEFSTNIVGQAIPSLVEGIAAFFIGSGTAGAGAAAIYSAKQGVATGVKAKMRQSLRNSMAQKMTRTNPTYGAGHSAVLKGTKQAGEAMDIEDYAAQLWKMRGGVGASTLNSLALNSGEIYNTLRGDGFSHDESQAPALAFGSIAALPDSLLPAWVARSFLKRANLMNETQAVKDGAISWLGKQVTRLKDSTPGKIGLGVALEGSTEGFQEFINSAAPKYLRDEDIDWSEPFTLSKIINASIIGAVAGGMGGLATVVGKQPTAQPADISNLPSDTATWGDLPNTYTAGSIVSFTGSSGKTQIGRVLRTTGEGTTIEPILEFDLSGEVAGVGRTGPAVSISTESIQGVPTAKDLEALHNASTQGQADLQAEADVRVASAQAEFGPLIEAEEKRRNRESQREREALERERDSIEQDLANPPDMIAEGDIRSDPNYDPNARLAELDRLLSAFPDVENNLITESEPTGDVTSVETPQGTVRLETDEEFAERVAERDIQKGPTEEEYRQAREEVEGQASEDGQSEVDYTTTVPYSLLSTDHQKEVYDAQGVIKSKEDWYGLKGKKLFLEIEQRFGNVSKNLLPSWLDERAVDNLKGEDVLNKAIERFEKLTGTTAPIDRVSTIEKDLDIDSKIEARAKQLAAERVKAETTDTSASGTPLPKSTPPKRTPNTKFTPTAESTPTLLEELEVIAPTKTEVIAPAKTEESPVGDLKDQLAKLTTRRKAAKAKLKKLVTEGRTIKNGGKFKSATSKASRRHRDKINEQKKVVKALDEEFKALREGKVRSQVSVDDDKVSPAKVKPPVVIDQRRITAAEENLIKRNEAVRVAQAEVDQASVAQGGRVKISKGKQGDGFASVDSLAAAERKLKDAKALAGAAQRERDHAKGIDITDPITKLDRLLGLPESDPKKPAEIKKADKVKAVKVVKAKRAGAKRKGAKLQHTSPTGQVDEYSVTEIDDIGSVKTFKSPDGRDYNARKKTITESILKDTGSFNEGFITPEQLTEKITTEFSEVTTTTQRWVLEVADDILQDVRRKVGGGASNKQLHRIRVLEIYNNFRREPVDVQHEVIEDVVSTKTWQFYYPVTKREYTDLDGKQRGGKGVAVTGSIDASNPISAALGIKGAMNKEQFDRSSKAGNLQNPLNADGEIMSMGVLFNTNSYGSSTLKKYYYGIRLGGAKTNNPLGYSKDFDDGRGTRPVAFLILQDANGIHITDHTGRRVRVVSPSGEVVVNPDSIVVPKSDSAIQVYRTKAGSNPQWATIGKDISVGGMDAASIIDTLKDTENGGNGASANLGGKKGDRYKTRAVIVFESPEGGIVMSGLSDFTSEKRSSASGSFGVLGMLSGKNTIQVSKANKPAKLEDVIAAGFKPISVLRLEKFMKGEDKKIDSLSGYPEQKTWKSLSDFKSWAEPISSGQTGTRVSDLSTPRSTITQSIPKIAKVLLSKNLTISNLDNLLTLIRKDYIPTSPEDLSNLFKGANKDLLIERINTLIDSRLPNDFLEWTDIFVALKQAQTTPVNHLIKMAESAVAQRNQKIADATPIESDTVIEEAVDLEGGFDLEDVKEGDVYEGTGVSKKITEEDYVRAEKELRAENVWMPTPLPKEERADYGVDDRAFDIAEAREPKVKRRISDTNHSISRSIKLDRQFNQLLDALSKSGMNVQLFKKNLRDRVYPFLRANNADINEADSLIRLVMNDLLRPDGTNLLSLYHESTHFILDSLPEMDRRSLLEAILKTNQEFGNKHLKQRMEGARKKYEEGTLSLDELNEVTSAEEVLVEAVARNLTEANIKKGTIRAIIRKLRELFYQIYRAVAEASGFDSMMSADLAEKYLRVKMEQFIARDNEVMPPYLSWLKGPEFTAGEQAGILKRVRDPHEIHDLLNPVTGNLSNPEVAPSSPMSIETNRHNHTTGKETRYTNEVSAGLNDALWADFKGDPTSVADLTIFAEDDTLSNAFREMNKSGLPFPNVEILSKNEMSRRFQGKVAQYHYRLGYSPTIYLSRDFGISESLPTNETEKSRYIEIQKRALAEILGHELTHHVTEAVFFEAKLSGRLGQPRFSAKARQALADWTKLYEATVRFSNDPRQYGLTSVREFISEARNNPKFQSYLKTIPLTTELANRFKIKGKMWDALGYAIGRVIQPKVNVHRLTGVLMNQTLEAGAIANKGNAKIDVISKLLVDPSLTPEERLLYTLPGFAVQSIISRMPSVNSRKTQNEAQSINIEATVIIDEEQGEVPMHYIETGEQRQDYLGDSLNPNTRYLLAHPRSKKNPTPPLSVTQSPMIAILEGEGKRPADEDMWRLIRTPSFRNFYGDWMLGFQGLEGENPTPNVGYFRNAITNEPKFIFHGRSSRSNERVNTTRDGVTGTQLPDKSNQIIGGKKTDMGGGQLDPDISDNELEYFSAQDNSGKQGGNEAEDTKYGVFLAKTARPAVGWSEALGSGGIGGSYVKTLIRSRYLKAYFENFSMAGGESQAALLLDDEIMTNEGRNNWSPVYLTSIISSDAETIDQADVYPVPSSLISGSIVEKVQNIYVDPDGNTHDKSTFVNTGKTGWGFPVEKTNKAIGRMFYLPGVVSAPHRDISEGNEIGPQDPSARKHYTTVSNLDETHGMVAIEGKDGTLKYFRVTGDLKKEAFPPLETVSMTSNGWISGDIDPAALASPESLKSYMFSGEISAEQLGQYLEPVSHQEFAAHAKYMGEQMDSILETGLENVQRLLTGTSFKSSVSKIPSSTYLKQTGDRVADLEAGISTTDNNPTWQDAANRHDVDVRDLIDFQGGLVHFDKQNLSNREMTAIRKQAKKLSLRLVDPNEPINSNLTPQTDSISVPIHADNQYTEGMILPIFAKVKKPFIINDEGIARQQYANSSDMFIRASQLVTGAMFPSFTQGFTPGAVVPLDPEGNPNFSEFYADVHDLSVLYNMFGGEQKTVDHTHELKAVDKQKYYSDPLINLRNPVTGLSKIVKTNKTAFSLKPNTNVATIDSADLEERLAGNYNLELMEDSEVEDIRKSLDQITAGSKYGTDLPSGRSALDPLHYFIDSRSASETISWMVQEGYSKADLATITSVLNFGREISGVNFVENVNLYDPASTLQWEGKGTSLEETTEVRSFSHTEALQKISLTTNAAGKVRDTRIMNDLASFTPDPDFDITTDSPWWASEDSGRDEILLADFDLGDSRKAFDISSIDESLLNEVSEGSYGRAYMGELTDVVNVRRENIIKTLEKGLDYYNQFKSRGTEDGNTKANKMLNNLIGDIEGIELVSTSSAVGEKALNSLNHQGVIDGIIDKLQKIKDGSKTEARQQSFGIAVRDKEGKLVLRKVANNYDGYHWSIAKGQLRPGYSFNETPFDVALRELAEETGISPETVMGFKIIGTLPTAYSSGFSDTFLYVAEIDSLETVGGRFDDILNNYNVFDDQGEPRNPTLDQAQAFKYTLAQHAELAGIPHARFLELITLMNKLDQLDNGSSAVDVAELNPNSNFSDVARRLDETKPVVVDKDTTPFMDGIDVFVQDGSMFKVQRMPLEQASQEVFGSIVLNMSGVLNPPKTLLEITGTGEEEYAVVTPIGFVEARDNMPTNTFGWEGGAKLSGLTFNNKNTKSVNMFLRSGKQLSYGSAQPIEAGMYFGSTILKDGLGSVDNGSPTEDQLTAGGGMLNNIPEEFLNLAARDSELDAYGFYPQSESIDNLVRSGDDLLGGNSTLEQFQTTEQDILFDNRIWQSDTLLRKIDKTGSSSTKRLYGEAVGSAVTNYLTGGLVAVAKVNGGNLEQHKVKDMQEMKELRSQRRHTLDERANEQDLADISPLNNEQYVLDLIKHVIADYVVGNRDGHAGNFGMANGRIVSFDKGQSFRFFDANTSGGLNKRNLDSIEAMGTTRERIEAEATNSNGIVHFLDHQYGKKVDFGNPRIVYSQLKNLVDQAGVSPEAILRDLIPVLKRAKALKTEIEFNPNSYEQLSLFLEYTEIDSDDMSAQWDSQSLMNELNEELENRLDGMNAKVAELIVYLTGRDAVIDINDSLPRSQKVFANINAKDTFDLQSKTERGSLVGDPELLTSAEGGGSIQSPKTIRYKENIQVQVDQLIAKKRDIVDSITPAYYATRLNASDPTFSSDLLARGETGETLRTGHHRNELIGALMTSARSRQNDITGFDFIISGNNEDAQNGNQVILPFTNGTMKSTQAQAFEGSQLKRRLDLDEDESQIAASTQRANAYDGTQAASNRILLESIGESHKNAILKGYKGNLESYIKDLFKINPNENLKAIAERDASVALQSITDFDGNDAMTDRTLRFAAELHTHTMSNLVKKKLRLEQKLDDAMDTIQETSEEINELITKKNDATVHEKNAQSAIRKLIKDYVRGMDGQIDLTFGEGKLLGSIKEVEKVLKGETLSSVYKDALYDIFDGNVKVFAYIQAMAELGIDYSNATETEIVYAINKSAKPELKALRNNKPLMSTLVAFSKDKALQMALLEARTSKDSNDASNISDEIKRTQKLSEQQLKDLRREVKGIRKSVSKVYKVRDAYAQARLTYKQKKKQADKAKELIKLHEDAIKSISEQELELQKRLGIGYNFKAVPGEPYFIMQKLGDTWVTNKATFSIEGSDANREKIANAKYFNKAYLAEQDAAGKGDKPFNRMLADMTMQLSKAVVHREYKSIRLSMLDRNLNTLEQRLRATGQAGVQVSRMIAEFRRVQQNSKNEQVTLSGKWEGAYGSAIQASGMDQSVFKDMIYDTGIYWIENMPEYASDPTALYSAVYKEIEKTLRTSGKVIKPELKVALQKLWVATENISEFENSIADAHNILVEDPSVKWSNPLTGKRENMSRRRIKYGRITIPRRMRGEVIAALTKIMGNAEGMYLPVTGGWNNTDLFNEINTLARNSTGDDSIYSDMIGKINLLFNDTIVNTFLDPLLSKPGDPIFVAPKKRGSTVKQPISQDEVMSAWIDSGKDFGGFVSQLFLMQDADIQDLPEFAASILKRLRQVYNMGRTIAVKVDSTPLSNEHAPHRMMDARTNTIFPREWLEYDTYTKVDTGVHISKLASVAAFGRDSSILSAMLDAAVAEARVLELPLADIQQDPSFLALRTDKERKQFLIGRLGKEKYNQVSKSAEIRDEITDIKQSLADLFSAPGGGFKDMRAFEELAGLNADLVLRTPKSGLWQALSGMDYTQRLGYGTLSARASGTFIYNSIKNLFGSIFNEGLGIPLMQATETAKVLNYIRTTPGQQDLTYKELFSNYGVNGAGQSIVRTSRRIKDGLDSVKLKLGKGLNGASGFAPFTPLSPFSWLNNIFGSSVAEGGINVWRTVITRAMAYIDNNPSVLGDPNFRFNLKHLGIKGSIIGGNERALEYLADTWAEHTGQSLLDFIKQSYNRKQGQQEIFSKDDYLSMYQIAMDDINLEGGIGSTPVAFRTNGILRVATPLLRWATAKSNAVHGSLKTQEGRYTVNSVLKGMAGITAVGMPIGIAATMLMDEYDEEILGKKSNLRSVNPINLMPGFAAFNMLTNKDGQGLAILERLARSGNTYGLGMEALYGMAAWTDPMQGQRALGIDRILVYSQIANARDAFVNIMHSGWYMNYEDGKRIVDVLAGQAPAHFTQTVNNVLYPINDDENRRVKRVDAFNYIRSAGRSAGLPLKKSGIKTNPTPITARLRQMQLAAYGDDPEEFFTILQDTIEAATEMGKEDPIGSIVSSWKAREPFDLFQRNLTPDEVEQVYSHMNQRGKENVLDLVRLHEKYLNYLEPKKIKFSGTKGSSGYTTKDINQNRLLLLNL